LLQKIIRSKAVGTFIGPHDIVTCIAAGVLSNIWWCDDVLHLCLLLPRRSNRKPESLRDYMG